MDPIAQFNAEKTENIKQLGADAHLRKLAVDFIDRSASRKYSYNFTWMGRPIIAFPTDMVAMQELIWEVKPDLIIETGIAHGGSLVYYASLLELIGGRGKVLGIDIDIRPHNRAEIEKHPMFHRIEMIEGSSTAAETVAKVERVAREHSRIMVCLDSNHTHAHVLEELRFYARLVSVGSYCVVFDTIIEDLPPGFVKDRPWDIGNNPKTAVRDFLAESSGFVDARVDDKLLLTVAPGGFLKRIS
jgi:cephalosporin hydroxylase